VLLDVAGFVSGFEAGGFELLDVTGFDKIARHAYIQAAGARSAHVAAVAAARAAAAHVLHNARAMRSTVTARLWKPAGTGTASDTSRI